MTTHSILVGYDASAGAESALGWALDESARTGTPITLVHAVEWRAVPGPIGLAPAVWPDYTLRELGEEMIAKKLETVRESHPDARVTAAVVDGPAAAALVHLSQRARLVVLGRRGHSAFGDLLVGSTSVAVAAHAKCPVVVVRGERPPAGAPVVVGFDDSDCARLALEFALAEAAGHGTGLRLVHTWAPPAPRWQPPGFDLERQVAAERAELEDLLAGWQDKYPQVSTDVRVVVGSASGALVEASQGARLVVVGSRGRGGFRGLLLGSVSQQLLHHAHCPVAVVRRLPD